MRQIQSPKTLLDELQQHWRLFDTDDEADFGEWLYSKLLDVLPIDHDGHKALRRAIEPIADGADLVGISAGEMRHGADPTEITGVIRGAASNFGRTHEEVATAMCKMVLTHPV